MFEISKFFYESKGDVLPIIQKTIIMAYGVFCNMKLNLQSIYKKYSIDLISASYVKE